jgi:hypothetical protein
MRVLNFSEVSNPSGVALIPCVNRENRSVLQSLSLFDKTIPPIRSTENSFFLRTKTRQGHKALSSFSWKQHPDEFMCDPWIKCTLQALLSVDDH